MGNSNAARSKPAQGATTGLVTADKLTATDGSAGTATVPHEAGPGVLRPLPLVAVEVRGDVVERDVSLWLTQTYANDTGAAVSTVYLLPAAPGIAIIGVEAHVHHRDWHDGESASASSRSVAARVWPKHDLPAVASAATVAAAVTVVAHGAAAVGGAGSASAPAAAGDSSAGRSAAPVAAADPSAGSNCFRMSIGEVAPGARIVVSLRLLAALTSHLPSTRAAPEEGPGKGLPQIDRAVAGPLCLTLPRYLLFPASASSASAVPASAFASMARATASLSDPASEAATCSDPQPFQLCLRIASSQPLEGVSAPDFAAAAAASSCSFHDEPGDAVTQSQTRRRCTFTLKLAAEQWRERHGASAADRDGALRIVMVPAAAKALPAVAAADAAAEAGGAAASAVVAPGGPAAMPAAAELPCPTPVLLVLEAIGLPAAAPTKPPCASSATAGSAATAAGAQLPVDPAPAAAVASSPTSSTSVSTVADSGCELLSSLDSASAMSVSLTVTPALARMLLATAPAAAVVSPTAPAVAPLAATATAKPELQPAPKLEPAAKPEFVFVLRTHPGCLRGDAHLKNLDAVQFALRCLPPGCRFGILAYASGVTSVLHPLVECDGTAGLVDYSDESLAEATRLLDNLSLLHRGADVLPREEHIRNKPNQLLRALQAATSRLNPASRRHVFLFTDGVDAGEEEAIAAVHTATAAAHGQLHVHAFGTGIGVSKRAVAGVAAAGCGFAPIVADREPVLGHVARAIRFAHQRGMVGVAVDWGCPHDDSTLGPVAPRGASGALAAAGSASSAVAAVGGAGAPVAAISSAPANPEAATITPALPCAASADVQPARLLAAIRKPTGAGSTAALLARVTITISDYNGKSVRLPLLELPTQVLVSPSGGSGPAPEPELATSATASACMPLVKTAGPVTLRALRTALHRLCAAAAGSVKWYVDAQRLLSLPVRASEPLSPELLAAARARAIALSEAWQLPCALTELIGLVEEAEVVAARDRAMQPERDARARWQASEAARREAWEVEQAPIRAAWEGTEAILTAEWEAGEAERQKAWAEWSAAEAVRAAGEQSAMVERRFQALQHRQERIDAAKARGDRLWTIYIRRVNRPRNDSEEPLAVRGLLPDDDYTELQWGVQALTGIPREIVLLTNGRNLYPGRTLSEWGFYDETTLHLIPRQSPEDRAHFERKPRMEYRPTRLDVEPFRPTTFVPPPLPADGGLASAACRGSGFDGSWPGDAWELHDSATHTDAHPWSLERLVVAAETATRTSLAEASGCERSSLHAAICSQAGVAHGAEKDEFSRAALAVRLFSPASHLLHRLLQAQSADGRFALRGVLAALAAGPEFLAQNVGIFPVTKAKEKLDAALKGLPLPLGGHPVLDSPKVAACFLATALLEAHCPDGKPIWSLMTDKSWRRLPPWLCSDETVGAVRQAIKALAAAVS